MANSVPLLKPSSTADRVASILRERILAMKEFAYLGSESELAEQIGVSLPTLRQAARMLEHEQLLKIKPGKGGGYFTRRPSIETAIRSASQYLSSRDLSSNAAFIDASDAVVYKLLEAACGCEDEELIAELHAFVDNQQKNSKNLPPPEESFVYTAELMNLFGRMSRNPLLELFVGILWNEVSVLRTTGTFEDTQQLVRTNYRTRLKVAEAVLKGDVEEAEVAWEKRSKFLRSWPQRGFHLVRQRAAV
jgi:GntR family transcriptional repressor for pyruvate dehydrogenase complex